MTQNKKNINLLKEKNPKKEVKTLDSLSQPEGFQDKQNMDHEKSLNDMFQKIEMSKKIARRLILKEKLIEKNKMSKFFCPLTEKFAQVDIDRYVSSFYVESILIHHISMVSRDIFKMQLLKLVNQYVKDHYSGYSEDEFLSREPEINIDYDLDFKEAWGTITISINDSQKKTKKR